MGRPRTGNDDMLRVRINPVDMEALRQIAERRGMTISELVRRQVRTIVRKQVEAQPQAVERAA